MHTSPWTLGLHFIMFGYIMFDNNSFRVLNP